jgi:uncharacterized damage-inducible protein DinB
MLVRYNRWANHRLYRALALLPDSEVYEPRISLLQNMLHALHHIYQNSRLWQAHLEQRPSTYNAKNAADYPTLAVLAEQQRVVDSWLVDWYDAASVHSLEEPVDYVLIGGSPSRISQWEVLLHLVTHGSYHRGHVADMFSQFPGHRPPIMDLPVYLSGDPARG